MGFIRQEGITIKRKRREKSDEQEVEKKDVSKIEKSGKRWRKK